MPKTLADRWRSRPHGRHCACVLVEAFSSTAIHDAEGIFKKWFERRSLLRIAVGICQDDRHQKNCRRNRDPRVAVFAKKQLGGSPPRGHHKCHIHRSRHHQSQDRVRGAADAAIDDGWNCACGLDEILSRVRVPLPHVATQHFTVGGATGAGKTLLITQLIDQVQDRASTDTAIIWDPTGVLMRRYFNPERGDIVLNPLDARCPSWNPAWELKGMSQAMAEAAAQAMGTSLYVGRATASDSDRFFTDAAIALWKHIVVNSSPAEAQELAYWMANATPELDQRVRGTKLEQDLDPGSTPQRNGIISTFTKVEHALSAIPLSVDAPRWTVKDWCANRKGWLFLTTTAETKESLRPIQSLWLDMLIRQLMAQGERPDLRAPWFFFDELAALQRLPTLESGLSEGRKFNLRFVLGFQAMSQVEALYSKEGAQTLLAMPKTQVLLRTGEAMAADWMSKQCGDQRIEELKESYPAAWSGGNGNRTVSTEIKDRRLFIPSEFMGLKDLRGILRHGNSLVRIEIPYMARVQRADAFVPRPSKPMPGPKPEPEMDPPQTVEPDSVGILEAVPAERGASESESQIEY